MRIETDVKLDFKDVLIRPKRSTLNTRSAVDVDRAFRFLHTGSEWKGFPLIAANMDVTGTMAMAHTLGKHGALTALHKHYPEPKLIEFFAAGTPSIRSARPRPMSRNSPRSPRRRRSGSSVSTSPTAMPRNSSRRSSGCATTIPTPSSWPAMSSPAT
jgi:hypothetical protein